MCRWYAGLCGSDTWFPLPIIIYRASLQPTTHRRPPPETRSPNILVNTDLTRDIGSKTSPTKSRYFCLVIAGGGGPWPTMSTAKCMRCGKKCVRRRSSIVRSTMHIVQQQHSILCCTTTTEELALSSQSFDGHAYTSCASSELS